MCVSHGGCSEWCCREWLCTSLPGVHQYPSHSCDFDISGKSGIAERLIQITSKYSEEPLSKRLNLSTFPQECVTVHFLHILSSPGWCSVWQRSCSRDCQRETLQFNMHFPNHWCGFMYVYMLSLLNLLGFFLTYDIPNWGCGRLFLNTPYPSLMPLFPDSLPAIRNTTNLHRRATSYSQRLLSLSQSSPWITEKNSHA